eukprot:Gb_36071 [translate_table: standard]
MEVLKRRSSKAGTETISIPVVTSLKNSFALLENQVESQEGVMEVTMQDPKSEAIAKWSGDDGLKESQSGLGSLDAVPMAEKETPQSVGGDGIIGIGPGFRKNRPVGGGDRSMSALINGAVNSQSEEPIDVMTEVIEAYFFPSSVMPRSLYTKCLLKTPNESLLERGKEKVTLSSDRHYGDEKAKSAVPWSRKQEMELPPLLLNFTSVYPYYGHMPPPHERGSRKFYSHHRYPNFRKVYGQL